MFRETCKIVWGVGAFSHSLYNRVELSRFAHLLWGFNRKPAAKRFHFVAVNYEPNSVWVRPKTSFLQTGWEGSDHLEPFFETKAKGPRRPGGDAFLNLDFPR